ncbi:MAG: thioredoxin-dependent thiol peroxidase [Agrococcus casei]|uniref:thioredoxin-dependent thiol peroxidase n=1 Tax=Agrococcus casei TaxID=343512 RepID=UPI003F91E95D
MAQLEVGQQAPEFTLKNQHGEAVSLSDLRGSKVVLWFYPEAMTSACRSQAYDFRDSFGPLEAAGYTVVGVSRDSVEKLASAAETDGLQYTLLSDPDHEVHEQYGTWGEKSMYGRTVIGVKRSTFVLDEHGVITHTFYNTKAKGHLAMLNKRLAFGE